MCGIFGIFSLSGEYISGSIVLRALTVMRERGTMHGAGVALYSPSQHVRAKLFTYNPPRSAAEVCKLPSGIYDVTMYDSDEAGDARGAVHGIVYVRSKWLDIYKVIGWPEDLDRVYGVSEMRSVAWLGHTRYPTNSPGGLPYYSHPFSAGNVAIVHNGDLSSYGANLNLLRYKFRYYDFTGNDSEVIAYLLWELYKRYGVEKAVEELMHGREIRWARLDGPYAALFIIGGPRPIFGAFVDTQHFRPLYVGMSREFVYAASEAAAIKAVGGGGVEIWALRGGEYIIAAGGEVWGHYRKRGMLYPDPPPQLPNAIDASLYGATELAPAIRQLLREVGHVSVINVMGHRYLGNGMEGGILKIWGVVGNASGNVMSGGEIYIYGDAQDDLGDAMNGGLIAVYGNVGDTVAQAKRGGEIYIYGSAGNRAGIQHRGGVLVIGGSAGDYLGEYMGGGTILVLRHTSDEEVGRKIGAGMVGGIIYIRGEVGRERIGSAGVSKAITERYLRALRLAGINADPGSLQDNLRRLFSLYHEVEVRELTEEEVATLTPYVRKFNALFNEDASIEREAFTIIRAGALPRE
jgi:glutamate synthase domain-containing protein 1/glutamate synthase domain-containing protein 3